MPLHNELGLDMPLQDVSHEAVLNIVRTGTQLSLLGAALFRRHDLTEAQFNVLFSLKYSVGKLTQTDLGKRLVVSRASITSVLDKLENKKLVERRTVEGNRRIYHVALTERGRGVVETVEPLYREKVHQVMATLNEAERLQLIRLLERVRQEGQVAYKDLK